MRINTQTDNGWHHFPFKNLMVPQDERSHVERPVCNKLIISLRLCAQEHRTPSAIYIFQKHVPFKAAALQNAVI